MAGETIGKKNVPFAEAIAYAGKRRVVLPESYYGELIGIQKSQAVSVAGLASIEQIKFVIDQLATVLEKGGTLESFKKAVAGNNLGIDLPKHRLDNIFRTNIQASYARGRWEQQTKMKSSRPFLMYDAINDGRTRPHHHAMDNTILPCDHEWWKTHYPPNGFRCRCTVISMTQAQAEKRGGVTPTPPADEADEGWDYNPGADYVAPVEKAVDKALEKAVVAKPKLAPKAAEVKKAIVKKATPTTLQSVKQTGAQELLDVIGEHDDYGTPEFFTRLENHMVSNVTGKPVDRASTSSGVQPDSIANYAKKHFKKGFRLQAGDAAKSKRTAEEFVDEVYSKLPLPASWLKAVSDYFPKVLIKYSENRAHAYTSQYAPHLSITPAHGDVVTHEFLHLVQAAKPELQALCRDFHAERTGGAAQKRLTDLFPRANYMPDEVTKEDKYYSAYMGREYGGDPLEILTMALQALLGDPTKPGNKTHALRQSMFKQDRATAEFALGLLMSYV